MLMVRNLVAGYGKKEVLSRISLDVKGGEIVALIGPNGSGKSTLLKCIAGAHPIRGGELKLEQHNLNTSTAYQNVGLGIILCPQGHRVFGGLTVMDNLQIAGTQLSRKKMMERINSVLSLYPVLEDRIDYYAEELSGGQRKLLAFARALIPDSCLLLLDEPTQDLSPQNSDSVLKHVAKICQETGTSALVAEHKVKKMLSRADRFYALSCGQVSDHGDAKALLDDVSRLQRIFLPDLQTSE